MARPEPINATQAHSKAKISLYFSDPLFVAGEHLSGKLELECKAERGLGISDIKVELFAIQELTSRDHSATNTFLHLTRYFQGPGLPPSNAVYPHPLPGNDNILPVNYYLARKGTTTFFFRFPLPPSSPASIDFGKGLAKLKYEVRANVGVSWRNECQRIMERREITVVEAPGDASDVERIVVGENGKIWAQARILNPYVVAGRDACVELFIKNHSNKRTTSLSLTIARYLHFPTASHIQTSLQLSDVLTTVPFRGPEYIVQPGTEGVANLVFTVPKYAQGVRAGRLETGEEDEGREPVESLFDLQCVTEVKIGMGLGNKDIVVELPVSVFHPSAMRILPPPAPPPEPYQAASPEYGSPQRFYSPPVQTASPYQSPPFSPTFDGYPGTFFSPPISPQIVHPGPPVWSPPPQAMSPQLQMPYDQCYYYPPPPSVNYAYPARPSSADPFVSRPLPSLPTQKASQQAPRPLVQGAGAVAKNEDRPEEGEAGKGESASRIAAHLRLSSRNRSASPPSHRFPQASRPPVLNDLPGGPLQVSPRIDAFGVEFPRSSPTGNQNNPELLSPRPVLTPKQSFSFDRGTVRSDHVIGLERIAAEQEAETEKDDGGERNNKTLPRPSSPPFASDTPDTPRLPPEPTLHPLPTRPRPRQRPEVWDRESGLTALERKLLEQVGTRKPDTERRPDVRSVLPEPIKIPSLNDPRCNPPNDSAISSLALGADISLDDRDVPPPKLDVEVKPLPPPPAAIKRGEQSDQRRNDRSPERHQANGKGRKKRGHAHHLREDATGRVAAWLGGLESASPPETQSSPFGSPAAPVHDLPSPKDLDPHVLLHPSPAPVSNGNTESKHDRVPTRSSGFVLHAAKDNSTFEIPSSRVTDDSKLESPYPNGDASPSEMTSVLASTSPYKPVLRRFAELQSKPQQQLDQNKYDVHSARGGRGGKVTSVTALWASLSQETSPPAPQARKGKVLSPISKNVPRIKDPPERHKPEKIPPHIKKGHDDIASNGANTGDSAARRAKMIKSTSLPAVVSSSLAIPVLSSTASLARPIQAEYPGRSYPPRHTTFTITEQQGEIQSETTTTTTPRAQATKSPAASDLAFGQARLKDLIKKYQQGFGQ